MPLGVLPAPPDAVIDLAADARPVAAAVPDWVRPALTWTGLVFLVAVLVPPLSALAGRYEFVEALRFSVLAVAVPALLALGAPWRSLHLAAAVPASGDGEGAVDMRPAPPTHLVDRVAAGRRRHLGFGRGLAALLVEMTLVLLARTPAVVDAIAEHSWLALVEAAVLIAGGLAFWLEIVESPPLRPRLSRPKRIALAAVAMWTVWVSAYIMGLSHGSVYSHYHQLAGGLSVAADQELATFVLWFIAAAAFVPIVFWNLVAWLRADEDPDDSLQRIVRESHRRTWGPAPGPKD